MAPSQPRLSGLHSGVTSPPLFEPEQEQQHYHNRHDHHMVAGHGLWGQKGKRSQKSSGPRCQAPEGQLSTRHPPPTLGQPAVTLYCRDEWQMVLSLEGRRTGSEPPAGLCEAVRADGLRWSPCHVLPDLMVCAAAWSRPSPSLGRDEGASAKLSEDKEDPGHLGS